MRSRNFVVPVALVLLSVSCGSGSDESDATVPEVTLLPTTTVAPETTVPADSQPTDITDAATTTDAVVTTSPETSTTAVPSNPAPPVETTTTTMAPPTTESLQSRFSLDTDGLGSTSFGADPDGTVAFISTFLGPPTLDTGWVDPFTIGPCGGSELRQVTWGTLQLEFGDASSITQGRRHFYAYTYGQEGSTEAIPAGLETPEGITVGSSVGALLAAYPATQLIVGDEFISDNFVVNDNLRGRLSGLSDTDVVQVIIGGLPCEG
jgi:hypothetical protein